MPAKLTISLSPEVLAAMCEGPLEIKLVTSAPAAERAAPTQPVAKRGKATPGAKRGPKPGGAPRSGTLPDRLLKWAANQKGEFRTAAVAKKLGIRRTHASLLLGRLAKGKHPLERTGHGLYRHTG